MSEISSSDNSSHPDVYKRQPINFISPQGKFLAKVCGETKGNVFLRVQQIDKFRAEGLLLTQNTMAAKFSNCRQLIRLSLIHI